MVKVPTLSKVMPDTRMLWDETLDYFERLGIYHVRDIIPYYLCSIGCHVANLANKKHDRPGHRVFYTRAGTVPDLRLHLYLVGPPGFSKSFFANLFFAGGMKPDPKDRTTTGIATTFPNYELGNITSVAPIVGSLVNAGLNDEGELQFVERKGFAKEFPEHMFWAEEFGSIRDQMRSQMGIGLLDVFLKLLDEGKAERNMLGGRIEVVSYSTYLLGTQTERVDLPSGMARRGMFVDLTPTGEDIRKYNEAWENTENVKPEWDTINALRVQYKRLFDNFHVKGTLQFTDRYIKYRRGLGNKGIIHTDKEILNRLAIGYSVMTNYDHNNGELVVDLTPELKSLIENAILMKFDVLGQEGYQQIVELVREAGDEGRELYSLMRQLVSLHMSYKNARKRLKELVTMGVFTQKRIEKAGSKKPVIKFFYAKDIQEIDWGDIGDE